MRKISLLRALVAAAWCAAALAMVSPVPGARAEGADGKGRSGPGLVVVEMYTSQSCSSCPPADAYLGELAGRKDVLALSMHVDYWNALGWRDPFSRPDITARQKGYMQSLGTRYVSTPQAIIQGRAYAVGSDRDALPRLIDRAKAAAKAAVQPRITMPRPDQLAVHLPDGPPGTRATVWFVAFDDRHTARITGGENSGATVTYTNVVRDLRRIGTWDGRSRSFEVDISTDRKAGYGNCAILVQTAGVGPILGAAAVPMASSTH
ncbi:MAG: DUF1223 domain-containing protein [Alphaproteobacteria bacterium]|nr:DUF1223 domain-containing protein [Alphaproteobacteria bacterium]